MLDTALKRLYKVKLIAMGALVVLAGLVVTLLSDWLSSRSAPHLLVALLSALSDALVVSGGLGIAIDFFTGRDKDAADTERTRSVLKELTPDFTDAVGKGFASSPDDLKRVATPELLDAIATNALSLRLGGRTVRPRDLNSILAHMPAIISGSVQPIYSAPDRRSRFSVQLPDAAPVR